MSIKEDALLTDILSQYKVSTCIVARATADTLVARYYNICSTCSGNIKCDEM